MLCRVQVGFVQLLPISIRNVLVATHSGWCVVVEPIVVWRMMSAFVFLNFILVFEVSVCVCSCLFVCVDVSYLCIVVVVVVRR